MLLPLTLFIVAVIGFVLNRSHSLILLLTLELILLGITLMVIIASRSYDDVAGITLGIITIAIAGAESAVGLSIIVAYYRLRGNSNVKNNTV